VGGLPRQELVSNLEDTIAGHLLLTYLLGVGDRHNDNLMVTTEGKFFDIDFGYAFGNEVRWKKGFGQGPVKYTSYMMEAVQKGEKSLPSDEKRVMEMCVSGYKCLRKNVGRFMDVAMLVTPRGRHRDLDR
jgi:phosphatidylinositol 3-kinase